MTKTFKVIVAGGRDFEDYHKLCDKLDFYFSKTLQPIEIVCGKAKGADSLGDRYAQMNALDIAYFEPDWYPEGKLDKRAGILRNIEMGDYADALVAFYDGESRGTGHMIKYMTSLGKPVRIVKY